ncbi:hypothetical protein OROHE_012011 [Orobanche hederae]
MLAVPSNVVQKKIVARILVFKIRPSQDILKIRDGTPLEAEGILTYRKSPRNCSVWHFSSKLDVPSNVVQKKRVARILVFKIRPSQEILKIRDGTPFEMSSQEILKIQILKIRDGTPLEAEGILTFRKSKLDVPSNVVQKKRVARILVFKIRPSQEILKIRDGTPLEAEGILTYRKSPRNCSVWHFSSKLDVPSNVVQKKSVSRILVFKIRPFQEILKIRDAPLEAEGILTFGKRPSKLIEPSQEILKNRDGTPLEAEGILTYIKNPSQEILKIHILKIRDGTPLEWPSQEILKIRDEILKIHDGTLLELAVPSNVVQNKIVARILVFKIRPSQDILKIRDGTPLEAEGILTYRKSPRNCSVWHFSSKLDVPRNVVQKKRVARILVFKIRPSQEILKIRDGTPLEAQGILTYRKRPSQEILKIRDGTPLELAVPSNVVQKKIVARILVFKIRPSQDILKIRDGTPLEAEGILTYRKSPRNCSVWHFSSKLDVPSNVVQKKRVARILVFKIRPSQEILKIRDGTPLEAEGILTYRKRSSQEILKIQILKIRDGTPLE